METTGDHLFVDRLDLQFPPAQARGNHRFQNQGRADSHDGQNQFYIKRLVGLPGETVSIGQDRHARINGRRLDASTPHFENVYTFDTKYCRARPTSISKDQYYNGHILLPHVDGRQDSHLQTEGDTLLVRDEHYLVFGDNTVTSFDSRY